MQVFLYICIDENELMGAFRGFDGLLHLFALLLSADVCSELKTQGTIYKPELYYTVSQMYCTKIQHKIL